MTIQEIWEKYPPRKCDSQAELDTIMRNLYNDREAFNIPINEEKLAITKKMNNLTTQINLAKAQKSTLNAERLELETRQKEINRTFFNIKQQMLELNKDNLSGITMPQ